MVRTPDKTPHRLNVSHWIDYAWGKITANAVTNTWRKIGFGAPIVAPVETFENLLEEALQDQVDEMSFDLFDSESFYLNSDEVEESEETLDHEALLDIFGTIDHTLMVNV